MNSSGQKIAILFFLILGTMGNVFPQDQGSPPQIVNPNRDAIEYCNGSVPLAPEITIQNLIIDEASEGLKISVIDYNQGEDTLTYEAVGNLDYGWNNAYGWLEIKGAATSEIYQEAVRKVDYRNIAEQPRLDIRTFSISLLDADYLPKTKHFYRYISNLDITWKEAKAVADTMKYYNLQGYLTTITSADENNFIWSKIDGVGWIGASDEAQEGVWKWVTGPEPGTQFWQGAINGRPVNGQYSNWSSGEPNNAGPEHYAHINQHPQKAKKTWNDLKNEGDGTGSQYYRPKGFIVEFGGMTGEPEMQLSAEAKIKVGKIAFSNIREYDICQGETQQLNLATNNAYSYLWTPGSDMDNPAISNPSVSPETPTDYKAIGTIDFCKDSAIFKVNVNPLPVSQLESEYPLCEGQTVMLDAGGYYTYLWDTGETTREITVSEAREYGVTITNAFVCSITDKALVKTSIIPQLDYNDLASLVCGPMEQTLTLSFVDGTAGTILKPITPGAEVENDSTLSPKIKVEKYETYLFEMLVTDINGCGFSDTLEIEFLNQPTAEFGMDENECQGYNLKLNYTGNTIEDAIFYWYSNDTIYASGTNLDAIEIPLGYGVTNRSVGLKVDEQGCTDSLGIPVSVTPILDFWVENAEGCTPLKVDFDHFATEPVNDLYWEFGDGETSTEPKPDHTYQNAGTEDLLFDVRLTIVSDEGCKNTGILKDTVKVHPIPSVGFDFYEADCHGPTDTVSYEGSANDADKFLWDLSDFGESEILNAPGETSGPLVFNRSSSPKVEIGLRVISSFGCQTGDSVIIWKRKPVFDISTYNVAGCPPLKTNFSVTTLDPVDRVNYIWEFGDDSSATVTTTTHTYTEAGKKFGPRLIANSAVTNCTNTFPLPDSIFVFPAPNAVFTADPSSVLIRNATIAFQNKSAGSTDYVWDFGDGSFLSDQENPSHLYQEMGYFDVLLTAYNNFECTDTTSRQVTVTFDQVFPPTAFSPNAGFEQDREFRIHANGILQEGYQLLVFNRWGEVVFESENQEFGWDGKMKNGSFAPAGVYTWTIQYNDFTGKKHKQQGAVTLLF